MLFLLLVPTPDPTAVSNAVPTPYPTAVSNADPNAIATALPNSLTSLWSIHLQSILN